MPLQIEGSTFYRTKEACQEAGISRATLFRWLRARIFADVRHRDRRGWRLFTNEDVQRLKALADRIEVVPEQRDLF